MTSLSAYVALTGSHIHLFVVCPTHNHVFSFRPIPFWNAPTLRWQSEKEHLLYEVCRDSSVSGLHIEWLLFAHRKHGLSISLATIWMQGLPTLGLLVASALIYCCRQYSKYYRVMISFIGCPWAGRLTLSIDSNLISSNITVSPLLALRRSASSWCGFNLLSKQYSDK